MPVTKIDFRTLRPVGGSLQDSFQQLINLVARDTLADGQNFWVKGDGADGGVECVLIKKAGEEIGWQAKYVDSWDKAGPQLTKSFRRSLTSHPKLDTFIVCVPFDLSDGRQKGERKSAKDKYDSWVAARNSEASKSGRKIEIVFWGKAQITANLLSGPSPDARLRYFFNSTVLTSEMLKRLFRRTVSALGSRYVAEHHISFQ